MDLTRRDVCAMGAGTAALIAFGLPAGATEEATEAAIAELTGGAEVARAGSSSTPPRSPRTATPCPSR